jgi:hypothetical protein
MCAFGAMPGASGVGQVIIRVFRDTFTLEHVANDESYRVNEHVRVAKEPWWRSVGRQLASDDVGGVFCDLSAEGISGWIAELLLLCWARIDDDMALSWGRELIELPEATLAHMSLEFGNWVPTVGSRPTKLVQTLAQMDAYRQELPGFEDQTLPELAASLGVTLEGNCLGSVISALRARCAVEASLDAQMDALSDRVEALIAEAFPTSPKTIGDRSYRADQIRKLRLRIREYLQRTGSLPSRLEELQV